MSQGWNSLLVLCTGGITHRSQARSREESRGDARIDLRVVSFDKTVMKQLLQGRMKPIMKPCQGVNMKPSTKKNYPRLINLEVVQDLRCTHSCT